MWSLTEITGLSYLNTSKVTDMHNMFTSCYGLQTIYVGDAWDTDAVTDAQDMFKECTRHVGGKGTTFDPAYVNAAYAHIDGGPDNPGYFTAKYDFIRGDVNSDDNVDIADVTALINYLLTSDTTGIDANALDCNQDSNINISDVTVLINYLLTESWN